MYSKNGKKILVSILTVIGVFVLLGSAAWADSFQFVAGTGVVPQTTANNGAVTISSNDKTMASTTVYSLPNVSGDNIKVVAFISGGAFSGKISVSTTSQNWNVAYEGGEQQTKFAENTVLVFTPKQSSDLLKTEEVTVTAIGDNGGTSESVKFTIIPVIVSTPIAMTDVVMYDGMTYPVKSPIQTMLQSGGKQFAMTKNVKLETDASAGWVVGDAQGAPQAAEVWIGSNVTASLSPDISPSSRVGVFFFNDKPQGGIQTSTVLPQAKMPATFTFSAGDLVVKDDANAPVAGVSGDAKIATFKASILPAVLSLDKTSVTFASNQEASEGINAIVKGKNAKALRIANADGTSADITQTMANGLLMTAKTISTVAPPTGQIIFSGTPKSEDKATFKVIAYSDTAATSIIASADLTVTVSKAQPVAGYTMTVENFTAVASKDVGTQAHAISFKKDGAIVTMPTLESLAFTQPSDPADPSKVVWNGLTLVADKATGKVTMTGRPQTDGSKNLTLHATSQAGTILDWTFSVTVSKSQPSPGSSSSGCDAGFGFAGLLALGAFAGFFRRGR